MRFQGFDMVDADRLAASAARFGSSRVESAVGEWLRLSTSEREGDVEL